MRAVSSPQNPLVKHWSKLVKERRYRLEQGRVFVTGASVVAELAARLRPLRLLLADTAVAPAAIEADEVYQLPEALMGRIAGLEQLHTVAAEFPLPEPSSMNGCERVLVLDAVSDPGNLGTLIRSAVAFGWDAIWFLEGCVDLFNNKALRAARGATFGIKYQIGSWQELCQQIEDFSCFVADIHGEAPEELEPQASGPLVLILGNEARGPRDELVAQARAVTLPMAASVESLNVGVAGSILMYLWRERA